MISILIAALLGCSGGTRSVYFKLPSNFRGVIEIRESPGGLSPHLGDGLVIDVPDDGLVTLTSLAMFHEGVNEQIIAADGTVLELNEPTEMPGITRAYSLGYSIAQGKPGRIGYFIGTPEEFRKLDKAKAGF
jgi:hypothetical protein